MSNEASILLLAVFVAIVVTLLVEYLRIIIARRILIIGGAGILTVVLIFYLLSSFLPEKLVEPDSASQSRVAMAEPAADNSEQPLGLPTVELQSSMATVDDSRPPDQSGGKDAAETLVASTMQPKPLLISASKGTQALHAKSTQKLPGEFPEASLRYLTGEELKNRTSQELKIMRNEIFARHSYIFKNKNMNDHFIRFSWYRAEYVDITTKLTAIENANIRQIRKYENLNR